jgi:hypothetical protein
LNFDGKSVGFIDEFVARTTVLSGEAGIGLQLVANDAAPANT